MKKLEYKWIDVSAELHDEITNKWDYIKWDYIQSEVFEDGYDIVDFYADQSGEIIRYVAPNIYSYVNDNGNKRIVEIMTIDEI